MASDFTHFPDEFVREVTDGMRARYHELMDEALRELFEFDQFKPVGILSARGMCEVEPAPYAGPLRTEVEPGTLAERMAEALAELEAPISPHEWAVTPEPCSPPPAVAEPLPPRYSRPLRMWP